jgi:hypothetical protein
MPVNYFSMWGSFFINSYDSNIVLHPHSFLNYYEKLNINRVNIIKKILIFNKKFFNIIFYSNIINNYKRIFFNNVLFKLDIYYNTRKNDLITLFNKMIMFFILKDENRKDNIISNFLKIRNYSYKNNFLFLKKINLLKNYVKNTVENYLIKIYKTNNINNKFI